MMSPIYYDVTDILYDDDVTDILPCHRYIMMTQISYDVTDSAVVVMRRR